jgi:serpin B
MKLTFVLSGLFLFVATMVYGLENPVKPTSKIEEAVLQTAHEVNSFAVDFYNRLPKNQNICFSPYSISSAFAMVYNGAMGNTQKEIAHVFNYPKSMEDLDKGWFELNKLMTFHPSNASDDMRLRLGNSLWIQTNFPVLPTFRDRMAKYFESTFRFVDFKTQAETARNTINAWVKQNTFGKIVDILPPQAVDNSTRMVLISALYLKARWKNPFDPHLTNQQPFFSEDGTTQTTLSMSQSGQFPYLDTSEAALLEMPYIVARKDGPEFAMLIVLPHQHDGLSNVEKSLTLEKIEDWIKNLRNSRVIMTIPKFKNVQSSNLNELFKEIGMTLAFSDEADFSGISGVKGLKIGNIMHKVYLSVDETGSEAAAATAIGMNTTAVFEPQTPVIFQADHPFLYMIFEKSTGLILFMGRVATP